MPLINIAENLKVGTMQVLRVMNRLEQVWPPEPLCLTFSDDFERLELGPTWVDGPIFTMDSFTVVRENAIDSGAYVAGENDEPAPTAVMGSIRTVAEYPGNQFVEATVGNYFQGHDPCVPEQHQIVEGELWLFTQVAPDSNACLAAYVIIQVGTTTPESYNGFCYMQIMTVAPDGTRAYFADGTYVPLPAWRDNPDYLVRFESTAEGHCKAFFGGHLVVEDDVVPVGGPHVGVAQQWNRTSYGAVAPSPPFCDDFERADGALGADWTHTAMSDDYNDISTTASISSGVVVTAVDTGSGAIHHWATYHTTATLPSGDRYVEFEVARYGYGWSVYVYSQMNATDWSRQYLYVQINDAGTGTYQYDIGHLSADGTSETSIGGSSAAHATLGSTVLFRFESDDDGTNRLLIDGVQVLEAVDPNPVIGQPHAGFSMTWVGTASPPTGLGSFCAGGVADTGCELWSDDFERVDGPLGPNWTLGFGTGSGEDPVLPTISSGAAVYEGRISGAPTGAKVGTMSWVNEIGAPSQYLEVTFDNWHLTTNGSSSAMIESYVLGDPALGVPEAPARRACGFYWSMVDGGQLTVSAYTYLDDGNTSLGASVQYGTAGSPYSGPTGVRTLRLESYADGRQVVKLDGDTVIDYVETEAPWTGAGRTQGLWMSWLAQAGDSSPRILSISGGDPDPQPPAVGTSPRFEAVTGGQDCLPPCWICDDFERTDLGPDWVLPAGHPVESVGWFDTPQHHTIDTGAATGPVISASESVMAVDFRPESIPGDHVIETTFSLPASTPPVSSLEEIWYHLVFDPTTWNGISAWVLQNTTGFRLRFILWVDGVRVDDSYDYFHEWGVDPHTLTMRFEATATGLVRALIDGTPVDLGPGLDYQFTGLVPGTSIGIGSRLELGAGTPPSTIVPRIEAVCGGACPPL